MNALVVLGLLAAAPSPGSRELVDRIVAVVNDDVITHSELEAAIQPFTAGNPNADKQALQKDALDQLIADKLLSQQVREAKITITDEDVDRAIEDITRQNNITKEELRQAVESRGMSMAQYRSDLERQLVRLKVVDLKVRARVVVPESEVKAEYERETGLEKRDELIHLRHLFFRWGESPDPAEQARVLERARVARARVLNGEDFAKVAADVSEGPTAAQGGDLGEMSKQGLLPELARALVKLSAGVVSEPIQTANGVHVVRVEGTRAKDAIPYEQAKTRIYQRLYQAEVERQMKLWIDELRAASAVEIRT